MTGLILALALAGQCPPGSTVCPQRPARTTYDFRESSGNPAPWTTAVRLTVRMGDTRRITGGSSETIRLGSGTVIDGSPENGLIATCSHVIEGAVADQVEIETFALANGNSPPTGRYKAVSIGYDPKLDVGYVGFEPSVHLPASPMSKEDSPPDVDADLCSVGCNGGANPTARGDRFKKVVHGVGSADPSYRGLECLPATIEGRSGGGLFDEDGSLIGICNFRLIGKDRGIFAPVSSLRSILPGPRKKAVPSPVPDRAGLKESPFGPLNLDEPEKEEIEQGLGHWAVAGIVGLASAPLLALIASLKIRLSRASSRLRHRDEPEEAGDTPEDSTRASTAPSAPIEALLSDPEMALEILIQALEARDKARLRETEEERKAREKRETLDKIRTLLSGVSPPKV